MTGKIRTILDDPDYYAIIFKIMEREMSPMKNWTDGFFSNRIPKRLNVEGRDLKVLGVGSGSGELEFRNTLQLLKTFPNISHTAIEPAKDHVDDYKELVAKEASKLKGVTYHWRQQTLDQYRDEVGTTKKYDVIVAVNCAYYFDDVEDSLMYLRDILEEGGVLIIVVVSENGASYKIWKRFPEFYEDFSFKKLSSAQLIDILKNRDLDYETDRLPSDIDITKCFEDNSEEGQHLIDFLSHVVNLRESVPTSFYTEFVSFLKESSHEQTGVNMKWMMGTEQEAIFVHKET